VTGRGRLDRSDSTSSRTQWGSGLYYITYGPCGSLRAKVGLLCMERVMKLPRLSKKKSEIFVLTETESP
jgi:hypothetical protein